MFPERRTLVFVARAAIGLALLAFIVWRLDPAKLLESSKTLAWGAVGLAVLAQASAKIVWAIRWREILRTNGIERGFWDLLALVFVGLFFNNFLPTSVGGDLVRGYYTSRSRGGMAASYAALLVERALGFITLAALAGGAAGAALVLGSPVPQSLLALVLALGLVLTLVGTIVFAWRGWRRWVMRLVGANTRAVRLAEAFWGALDLFRRADTPRAWIVLNSMALQIIAVLFHVACARAVGLDTPAVVLFLVVPASVLMSMLPVSINGLGVREGVLVGLLTAQGAPPATAGAFAVLALLVSTAFALAGGIVYPFYRAVEPEARSA